MLGKQMFHSRKELHHYVRQDPDLHEYVDSQFRRQFDEECADCLYREYLKMRRKTLRDDGADAIKAFIRDTIDEIAREQNERNALHLPWQPGIRQPWGDERDGESSDDLVATSTARSKIGSTAQYIRPVDKVAGMVTHISAASK